MVLARFAPNIHADIATKITETLQQLNLVLSYIQFWSTFIQSPTFLSVTITCFSEGMKDSIRKLVGLWSMVQENKELY
jgi:hypothetical protein